MSKRNALGDEIYNARRREFRAAIRYLDMSEKTSGVTASRQRQLAKKHYDNALELYASNKPQRQSSNARRLQEAFGYGPENAIVSPDNVEINIARSLSSLQSSMQGVDARREAEARALLNDDTIGSRILGGLVDVWREAATVLDENGMTRIDNTKIVPALLDYFKVDSLADMIEKLEETIGSSLYDLKGNIEDIYEYVRLTIARKVRDNTLIQ